MFNLEQSITEWRAQMLAAGIQSPVPLEELENHLREEIVRHIQTGTSSQVAFEISVRQIGQPEPLENEFKKIRRMPVKQTIKIIAVLLVGIALQFPGSFQLRDELVITDGKLGLWLLGLVLQMRAAVSLWRAIQSKFFDREPEKIELSFPKLTLKTGVGGGILLVGIALMLPAGVQACRDGVVRFDALCWLVMGFALFIAGALVAVCPYRRRSA